MVQAGWQLRSAGQQLQTVSDGSSGKLQMMLRQHSSQLSFSCRCPRRGAACFGWDEGRMMLAAAVKRKLLLFHYDDKDFVELKEVALSEAPLCAAWSGNYVCLGCKGSCVRLPVFSRLSICARCDASHTSETSCLLYSVTVSQVAQ